MAYPALLLDANGVPIPQYWNPVGGTGTGGFEPITGSNGIVDTTATVTANLGILNGAATAANQTTGNTSLVTIATNTTNPVLGAGTAIAGKFGIDQTTPGTTNGVLTLGSSSGSHGIAHVVTPGTAVQLPAAPCRKVTLIGLAKNVGSAIAITGSNRVYTGFTTVSATNYGVALAADMPVTYEVSNANLIWIDADVANEGVSYFVV
jgi:hypothetical protein